MKEVQGGVKMDGITKPKRRRMESALGRLRKDITDMELKAITQDGGLARHEELRYHEMQRQAEILASRI